MRDIQYPFCHAFYLQCLLRLSDSDKSCSMKKDKKVAKDIGKTVLSLMGYGSTYPSRAGLMAGTFWWQSENHDTEQSKIKSQLQVQAKTADQFASQDQYARGLNACSVTQANTRSSRLSLNGKGYMAGVPGENDEDTKACFSTPGLTKAWTSMLSNKALGRKVQPTIKDDQIKIYLLILDMRISIKLDRMYVNAVWLAQFWCHSL